MDTFREPGGYFTDSRVESVQTLVTVHHPGERVIELVLTNISLVRFILVDLSVVVAVG